MPRRLMLAMVGLVTVVLLIADVGTLLLTRNQARQQFVAEAQSLTQSKLSGKSLHILNIMKATLMLENAGG